MAAIYQRLQFRRGQAGHFAIHNPILASGEPAFTMDTQVMKVGNGADRWNDLPVFSSGVSDAAGATFAQLATVSGMLDIASGIAVYSSGQQSLDVSKINAVSGIASTASGISIFASGQTILLTASSGALNTSVGLLEVSSGNLNTSSGLLNTSVGVLETNSGLLNTSVGLLEVASGALNTSLGTAESDIIIVSGIAGAGGVDGINAASGIAATASGISVFASGQVSLLPADSNSIRVLPINIDNLSGIVGTVGPSQFPTFIYKPSGQTLNTKSTVVSNDLQLGAQPIGGWRTGSLGEISTTSSGISFFGSGQSLTNADDILIVSGIAEAGGGGGATASQLTGVSGIADTASGISVFASGQTILLAAASGALNTSLGVAESDIVIVSGIAEAGGGGGATASQLTGVSGIADTASGISVFASGQTILNTSNNTIVSGISVHSVSGSVTYNSTASGNISGINTMLLVDQAAYNSLNKDSNTLYFIPE